MKTFLFLFLSLSLAIADNALEPSKEGAPTPSSEQVAKNADQSEKPADKTQKAMVPKKEQHKEQEAAADKSPLENLMESYEGEQSYRALGPQPHPDGRQPRPDVSLHPLDQVTKNAGKAAKTMQNDVDSSSYSFGGQPRLSEAENGK